MEKTKTRYLCLIGPTYKLPAQGYLCDTSEQAVLVQSALRWRAVRLLLREKPQRELLAAYGGGRLPTKAFIETVGEVNEQLIEFTELAEMPDMANEIHLLERSLPYVRPVSYEGRVLVRRDRWLRGKAARDVSSPLLVVRREDGYHADILGMSLRMRDTVLDQPMSAGSQQIEDRLLRELQVPSVADLQESKLMDVRPYLQEVPAMAGMEDTGMIPLHWVLRFINNAESYDKDDPSYRGNPSSKREELLQHYFAVYLQLQLSFV